MDFSSLVAPFEVKSVSADGRSFKGLSSTWDEDLGGDVVHKGAFARTLDHWRQSGRTIPLTDGHPELGGPDVSAVRHVLGKMTEGKETGDGFETDFEFVPDDELANAASRRVKGGFLTGLSITYKPIRFEREAKAGQRPRRHLYEVKLWSVGLVIHPMNQNSHADPASVKSLLAAARDGTLTDEEKEELRALLDGAPAAKGAAPPEAGLAPDDARRIAMSDTLRHLKLRSLATA
jgi:HK97 family phage prohead protease